MSRSPTTPVTTEWWRSYPDVWAAEQAALVAAGARWSEELSRPSVNSRELRTRNAVPLKQLRLDWPHPARRRGDPAVLVLHVTFPAAYPWWPPRVHLPEPLPAMRRHRNPISGALCLVADPGDWHPGTSLADLLQSQLPRLLAASRDDGFGTVHLEHGAEPAWSRFRLSPGAVLVGSGCLPPADITGGWADMVPISRWLAPVSALVALCGPTGQPLWSSDTFAERPTQRVPWVRLPSQVDAVLGRSELWARALQRLNHVVIDEGDPSGPTSVLVLMPGEGPARQAREDWLLLALGIPEPGTVEAAIEGAEPAPPSTAVSPAVEEPQPETHGDAGTSSSTPSSRPSRADMPVRVRRSYPVGRNDLTARMPSDAGHLAEVSVTVVGVGAIGGPVSLELARAGVGEMRLIDADTHDPATGARQLPTLQAAGSPKAVAVALSILDSLPHVQLSAGLRALGDDDGGELPALAASTLVVDCTANPAANRYLAAQLAVAGTPLLIAAATSGGWGGTITTLPSVGGGCWECLQWHRAERSLPWPPAQPDGELTPVGCSDPTYVGGWFDLGQVALQTARTALDVLGGGPRRNGGKGPAFGDVQILSLYRRGRPTQPRWRARRLTVHPSCQLHPGAADR